LSAPAPRPSAKATAKATTRFTAHWLAPDAAKASGSLMPPRSGQFHA
jgi:hypothetical protein